MDCAVCVAAAVVALPELLTWAAAELLPAAAGGWPGDPRVSSTTVSFWYSLLADGRAEWGEEVSALGDAIVGVVANPLSGRDIRRLVTQASVFPTAEKANMIQRMLTAFGATGVQRVLLSTDLGGISASVFRAIERHRHQDARWPEVDFLDGRPIRQTAQDTVDAVRRMVTAGARVVVCLGGDGTARVAASAAGDVPMLALSTGTNNVFPAVREATIAGLAAGLIATGMVPAEGTTTRAKLLEVRVGDRTETALVDIAVSTERHVGARAVWDPATVTQLFCAFAEPDAIGLSSVLGQLSPVARHEPHGVTARLATDAPRQVLAPIAPGLVVPVGVREIEPMHPGLVHVIDARAGVIAVDGERELTFGPDEAPSVRLRADGPRCVDIPAVLAASARLGLLRRTAADLGSADTGVQGGTYDRHSGAEGSDQGTSA